MIHKCKLCGRDFETNVHNQYICSNQHYVNCRICNKPVSMDGDENKKKRKMYFSRGFVYCSHECSCKGAGIDKYEKANESIDLDKLKYLKVQTSKSDKEIARELGVSVDFIRDRCSRYNWEKSKELKEIARKDKNKKISDILIQKYQNSNAKNNMVEKCRKTYEKKTGYICNFVNPEFKKKSAETKLNKYGDAKYTNSEKMIETRKFKNGGKFWTPEQIKQCEDTKKEKYGAEWYKLLIEKTKQTKLERYGNANYTNGVKISNTLKNKSDEEKQLIKLKIEQTKLEKYGDANYNNALKRIETLKNKYNVTNPDYCHISNDVLEIILNKEQFREYIKSVPYEERTTLYFMNKFGISQSTFNSLYHRYNCEDIDMNIFNSSFEASVKQFIKSNYDNDIYTNVRNIIYPYELDIYIPDRNLAIECDGTFWHSARYKETDYHYKKSKLCEEKGIRLIHIFEYEWENERQRLILENIIRNALGINNNKIYARKLKIEVKPSASMREFFETNNIQGFRGGKFAICLVDKNTNEVFMSYMYGHPYFGKGRYEWEVIRGATKLGYTVIGGASKIWNYFIKTYNPKSCVYYIDYNYFNGNSMKNLPKMQFIKTQPSFKNFWVADGIVKNREPARHKEIKELEKQGLVIPIYNAGTKVYLWEKT